MGKRESMDEVSGWFKESKLLLQKRSAQPHNPFSGIFMSLHSHSHHHDAFCGKTPKAKAKKKKKKTQKFVIVLMFKLSQITCYNKTKGINLGFFARIMHQISLDTYGFKGLLETKHSTT